jgi:hypothetical protein
MKTKKIILKKPKKPGPKPKPKAELYKRKTITFPPCQFRFLCFIDNPSEHIQKLLNGDSKYQDFLNLNM